MLVLGFVGAALTAAGPTFASNIQLLPLFLGVVGVGTLIGSAFVGLGVYTVTEYPLEAERQQLSAARHAHPRDWFGGSIERLNATRIEINQEVNQNAAYLEISMALLILGTLVLLASVAATVVYHSFAVEPSLSLGSMVIASVIVWRVAKHISGGDT